MRTISPTLSLTITIRLTRDSTKHRKKAMNYLLCMGVRSSLWIADMRDTAGS